jgi:hypothetical protein
MIKYWPFSKLIHQIKASLEAHEKILVEPFSKLVQPNKSCAAPISNQLLDSRLAPCQKRRFGSPAIWQGIL